ncbi:MAG TPA: RES family NAD+ phosphorylase [Usitatibacter sp.]|nr:RES family NAD+ phosphorylase [Usitatibacter sp.]
MRAYRIVKKRHVLSAFSGEGAKAFGGRWNRPGIPMLYAAVSRALAALEALAHFQGAERHIELMVFEIEIPDPILQRVDESSLPPGWRTPDPQAATQDLGSEWQLEMHSVALLVPSVLIPAEHCVLLNPEHPDASRVMIAYPAAFAFDGRL